MSGCGLPAFEPNQPNEKGEKADGEGGGKDPEGDVSEARGAVAVIVFDVVVRIHQVAVNADRGVVRVAGNLLRFELGDAGFELLIAFHEGLVAGGIHVVAMMIGPIGAVIERAVQQPPPEETVVGVAVNHNGIGVVGRENRVITGWPRADGDGVWNICAGAVGTARGCDGRGFCVVSVPGRAAAGGIYNGRRAWSLRFFEPCEFAFAGLFFAGASSG